MRATASYAAHRLIQDFTNVPGVAERFRDHPEQVLADYGVPPAEHAALRDGSPPALAGIGIHPILQVHYNISHNPMIRGLLGAQSFLARMDPHAATKEIR